MHKKLLMILIFAGFQKFSSLWSTVAKKVLKGTVASEVIDNVGTTFGGAVENGARSAGLNRATSKMLGNVAGAAAELDPIKAIQEGTGTKFSDVAQQVVSDTGRYSLGMGKSNSEAAGQFAGNFVENLVGSGVPKTPKSLKRRFTNATRNAQEQILENAVGNQNPSGQYRQTANKGMPDVLLYYWGETGPVYSYYDNRNKQWISLEQKIAKLNFQPYGAFRQQGPGYYRKDYYGTYQKYADLPTNSNQSQMQI